MMRLASFRPRNSIGENRALMQDIRNGEKGSVGTVACRPRRIEVGPEQGTVAVRAAALEEQQKFTRAA
jgi:hypothetical protein